MIAAKGGGRVDELIELAESEPTLPDAAKAAVKVLASQIEGLDKSLDDLENEIAATHAGSEMSRLLIEVPGIGKLIASVTGASVPDPSVFKSGRDFAAWLGLTPRQNSSGGKQTLGGITKRGNRYIRKHLVLGGAIAGQAIAEGRHRCSPSWPREREPCAIGSSRCWRRSRRGWSRWRWPTNWPGSFLR